MHDKRTPHGQLSLGYRIGYRIRHVALTLFGPAQLGEQEDPTARLEHERDEKLTEARRQDDRHVA